MQTQQSNIKSLFNRNTDGFTIKNPLLRACIAICETTHDIDPYDEFHGLRDGKPTIGYVFLCMLVYKALNFSRDLGTADRIFSAESPFKEKLEELYKKFIPFYYEEEKAAIEELRNLHQHTQNKLSQYFNENNPLVLKRIVKDKYIYHLKKMCHVAKLLGYDHILFDMDTLNSYEEVSCYGYTKTPDDYGIIQHTVNIADVLYCCPLIKPSYSDSYGSLVEDDEWVVVNRSPNGLVSVPIDGISFVGEKIENAVFNFSKETAEFLWNKGKPIYVHFPRNFTPINELPSEDLNAAIQFHKEPTLWEIIKYYLCYLFR